MTVLQRLLSSLRAVMKSASDTAARKHLTVGHAVIVVPAGWIQLENSGERASARSPDGYQQLTISMLGLKADVSFDEFKLLCSQRIEAEKRETELSFLQADTPLESAGLFGMYYSGAERSVGRIFSGYLSLKKGEFVTVYVEGVGIAPKEHLRTFQTLVTSLRWL